ncbi:MAG TPA: hypothetical protein VGS07_27790 [Thermoanaerobaculia bacterium]|jgi:hypothetical protein|nr:hypothetical protein [Thermoanaerobaculia bacterium]
MTGTPEAARPSKPANGASPTLSDRFAMVVDLLKHEDILVNLRTNWTLAIQGLLFTAFATLLGLFEKFTFPVPSRTPIHAGLFLICGLGAASCVAAYLGVRGAERQQSKLSKWWDEQFIKSGDKSDPPPYPPLYPHFKNDNKHRASEYFVVLACIWVVIFITILFSSALVPKLH